MDISNSAGLRLFVRPIVKASLALLSLVFIQLFITVLPGLEATVSSTELSVAQILSAAIGIMMVCVVAWVGLRVHTTGKESDSNLISALARGARLIILLITVLLLHSVLKPVFSPFITPKPGVWVYDLVFLMLALVPLSLLMYRMATNLDEMTDTIVNFANGISSDYNSSINMADATSKLNTDNTQSSCNQCGTVLPSDSDFCPSCGTQISSSTNPNTR